LPLLLKSNTSQVSIATSGVLNLQQQHDQDVTTLSPCVLL